MKPQENHNASPPSDKYLAAWKFQSMFSHSIVLYNNRARLLEVRRFNIYFLDISLDFFVIYHSKNCVFKIVLPILT